MMQMIQYNRATLPAARLGAEVQAGGATYLRDVKLSQNPLKSVAKLFRSPLHVVGVSVSLCSLSPFMDDGVLRCNCRRGGGGWWSQ